MSDIAISQKEVGVGSGGAMTGGIGFTPEEFEKFDIGNLVDINDSVI